MSSSIGIFCFLGLRFKMSVPAPMTGTDELLQELPPLSVVDSTTIIYAASGSSFVSYQLSITTLFTSPVFRGMPTAPTPVAGDSSASIATTAFVQVAMTNVVKTTGSYADPPWVTSLSTTKLVGIVSIVNGGTGQASANAALNALLPAQGTHVNQFLMTDGANTSWVAGSQTTTMTLTGDATGTGTGTVSTVVSSYNGGTPFGSMTSQNANSVAITGGTVTGIPTPSSGSDAANKNYVDAVTTQLSPRQSCVAATTVFLSVTYNNGSSGVGATLTNAGALAAFTVDGVTSQVNDRVLVKNQSSSIQNGIYTVTTLGSASVAWVLTRATDYNSSSTVVMGTYSVIVKGTVNAGTIWIETNIGPFTIGTSPINFTQLSVVSQTTTFSGDMTGSGSGSIATTVVGLHGVPVVSAAPIAGNLLIASGSQWTSVVVTGDVTLSSSGVVIVTKTNGVAFAPSATVDTTDASNITVGTLPAARLPNPSSSSLGGVQSVVPVVNQWVDSISSIGVPHLSQPAFANLSGTVQAVQIPNGVVSYLKIQNVSPVALLGNPGGSAAPPLEITLGTGLSFSGSQLNAAVGGIPGGSNTQVQYNAFNVFAGSSSFTFDPSTSTLSVTNFVGAGGGITGLNASNLSSGTVPLPQLGASGTPSTSTFLRGDNSWIVPPVGTPGGTDTQVQYNASNAFAGSASFTFNSSTNTLSVTNFVGAGGGITGLNASNLSSGTVSTSRLGSGTASSTTFLRGDNSWVVPPVGTPGGATTQVQYNASNAFAGSANFTFNSSTSTLTVTNLAGAGSGITGLNASNFSSGTVPLAQLGTGTPSTSTFLRGDNSWATLPVSAGVGKTTWVLGAGTPVTVGQNKAAKAIVDQSRTLSKVYIYADTGPTGAALIVDIFFSTDNGVTFTSLWATNTGNRPTVAAGSKFGTTTSFDTTTLSGGNLLRIDVVQVGSTIAGQDVTVQLQYA
jgi:hypothetical protein